jgi:hypothetical protein
VPSEPPSPDKSYEDREVRERIRAAIALLPSRERKVIGLYYYGEATMKQIGAEIGVNESRVSQLHARAIQRLRKILGGDAPVAMFTGAVVPFERPAVRLRMAKARIPTPSGVVLPYQPAEAAKPRAPRRTALRRAGSSVS